MKSSSEMRLFLVSMFSNMIVSYLIGFKYKDGLITSLSPAIYYQLIVFISLLLPYLIKYLDRKVRLHLLSRGIKKLKNNLDLNAKDSLDENTRKMFDSLVDNDFHTATTIKNMHDELEDLKK